MHQGDLLNKPRAYKALMWKSEKTLGKMYRFSVLGRRQMPDCDVHKASKGPRRSVNSSDREDKLWKTGFQKVAALGHISHSM